MLRPLHVESHSLRCLVPTCLLLELLRMDSLFTHLCMLRSVASAWYRSREMKKTKKTLQLVKVFMYTHHSKCLTLLVIGFLQSLCGSLRLSTSFSDETSAQRSALEHCCHLWDHTCTCVYLWAIQISSHHRIWWGPPLLQMTNQILQIERALYRFGPHMVITASLVSSPPVTSLLASCLKPPCWLWGVFEWNYIGTVITLSRLYSPNGIEGRVL